MKSTSVWQNRAAAVWGVVGVISLLGFAVYRLVPFTRELFDEHLQWWQLIILVVWCALMVYSEGYKAFYKQFSPRVVARAQYLSQKTTLSRTILAPLYCIGYFGAPKKRVITAYGLASGIILLVVIVHSVPQPWRGIIDAGVVLGLLVGIISIMFYVVRAMFRPSRLVADPEAEQ